MIWIVGLGNPGKQYEATRHNVGFMAIDRLSQQWGIPVGKSKCRALVGEGTVRGGKVALIKPLTFMNLSGEAVRAFMDFHKAELDRMIVIYDDLDTPFGHIRLRYQGSSGGHNGIKSIIQHVGTQTFKRVRIGISRPAPGREVVDYVLAPFSREEAKGLDLVLQKTADAVDYALTEPFDKVMARYNGSI